MALAGCAGQTAASPGGTYSAGCCPCAACALLLLCSSPGRCRRGRTPQKGFNGYVDKMSPDHHVSSHKVSSFSCSPVCPPFLSVLPRQMKCQQQIVVLCGDSGVLYLECGGTLSISPCIPHASLHPSTHTAEHLRPTHAVPCCTQRAGVPASPTLSWTKRKLVRHESLPGSRESLNDTGVF